MPDVIDHGPGNQNISSAGASGCVVFMVDESVALGNRIAGGTKTKAESIATALNSLLSQLAAGPTISTTIVGYGSTPRGQAEISVRWAGPLAGRGFVPSNQLADAPVSVQDRVRRVHDPQTGLIMEEVVRFPVWYAPLLGGSASKIAAFERSREMLSDWLKASDPVSKPPLVVSFVGELSPEEASQPLGGVVRELTTQAGPPLVLHAHLGSSDRIPATLYPSTDAHLPPGAIQSLFQGASVLQPPLLAALKDSNVAVNAGARGLIYNAKMVDLILFLSLVKAYTLYQPPIAALARVANSATPGTDVSSAQSATAPQSSVQPEESAAQAAETETPLSATETTNAEPPPAKTEKRALILLLLDRSVVDPTASQGSNPWQRLQEHANELIAQIAKRGNGTLDCAVVSYGRGTDASGNTVADASAVSDAVEVDYKFPGHKGEHAIVHDAELPASALRVDETAEKVSNGIGGLVSITRKKPIFIDMKPTAAASPSPAFATVEGLIGKWRADHPNSPVSPIVIHVTRGQFDPGQIDLAVGQLASESFTLYHLIVTESSHASLAYAGRPDEIGRPDLKKLWELTSPLLGRDNLAARKSTVSPQSRGIVINGKFDLLLEGIEEALGAIQGKPSEDDHSRTPEAE